MVDQSTTCGLVVLYLQYTIDRVHRSYNGYSSIVELGELLFWLELDSIESRDSAELLLCPICGLELDGFRPWVLRAIKNLAARSVSELESFSEFELSADLDVLIIFGLGSGTSSRSDLRSLMPGKTPRLHKNDTLAIF